MKRTRASFWVELAAIYTFHLFIAVTGNAEKARLTVFVGPHSLKELQSSINSTGRQISLPSLRKITGEDHETKVPVYYLHANQPVAFVMTMINPKLTQVMEGPKFAHQSLASHFVGGEILVAQIGPGGKVLLHSDLNGGGHSVARSKEEILKWAALLEDHVKERYHMNLDEVFLELNSHFTSPR